MELGQRLQEARRSSRVNLSCNDRRLIKRLIISGEVSKKSACMLLGMNYKQLKECLKSRC